MEKGGTTIYLSENENKFRTSCFSKYQVFKLKKKWNPLPFEWKWRCQRNFQENFMERISRTHVLHGNSTL